MFKSLHYIVKPLWVAHRLATGWCLLFPRTHGGANGDPGRGPSVTQAEICIPALKARPQPHNNEDAMVAHPHHTLWMWIPQGVIGGTEARLFWRNQRAIAFGTIVALMQPRSDCP